VEDILGNLQNFLKKFELTNYETSSYLALMSSTALTAKELTVKARVPTGRIYDVLERLTMLGLIEVQDTRPKKYRIVKPSSAFRSLIARFEQKNQNEIQMLYSQARELEKEIQTSNLPGNPQTPSSLFWSTSYGLKAISALYRDRIPDMEKEFLMTGFINEKTIKIIPGIKYLFGGLASFMERQGQVKILWSFDLDERNPSPAQLEKNDDTYRLLMENLERALHVSSFGGNFEQKYVNQRISTYFDIFDDTRVILKLRNPIKPTQIFACISVLDPNLARELKKYYMEMWMTTAIS
jgi:sugar-specific transcriptional regulator TrmB